MLLAVFAYSASSSCRMKAKRMSWLVCRNGTQAAEVASVEVICMILLPLAVLLCFYSLFIFLWRSQNIAIASSAPMNDRTGPVCLAGIVVLALSAIFIISIRELIETMHAKSQDMQFLLSCFVGSS